MFAEVATEAMQDLALEFRVAGDRITVTQHEDGVSVAIASLDGASVTLDWPTVAATLRYAVAGTDFLWAILRATQDAVMRAHGLPLGTAADPAPPTAIGSHLALGARGTAYRVPDATRRGRVWIGDVTERGPRAGRGLKLARFPEGY